MLQLMTDKIRKFVLPVLLLSILISVFSCNETEDVDESESIGNWTKSTPFKGRPRSGAVVFTIGETAFVGLGYDGDDYIRDFYSYNINKGFWEEIETFPGEMRERAVAFSLNGKGYVGLGYNRELDKEELGDFWEYDPDTDEWSRIEDFPGTARYNSVAFAVGTSGYIGTGYDGDEYNSDFYEFDGNTKTWREIVSYPGEKIESGVAFTVNNKGYVCAGRNNGLYNLDFWEFDPESVAWTKRSPDDDEADYDEFKEAVYRHNPVALTFGNVAYLVGGMSSSGAEVNTVYQFNGDTFNWDDRTSFEGSARSLAVGFVLNGRAFVGTGQNGTSRYDDVWEFKPDEEYDDTY